MMRDVNPRLAELKRGFGQRLGTLRREKGVRRQEDLAERSGISLRQIAAYERGESLPRLEQMIDLADALDVSLDELAGLPRDRRLGPDAVDLLRELEAMLRDQQRLLRLVLDSAEGARDPSEGAA